MMSNAKKREKINEILRENGLEMKVDIEHKDWRWITSPSFLYTNKVGISVLDLPDSSAERFLDELKTEISAFKDNHMQYAKYYIDFEDFSEKDAKILKNEFAGASILFNNALNALEKEFKKNNKVVGSLRLKLNNKGKDGRTIDDR